MVALSKEEKVACSDLFYYATGERIEPNKWNSDAAILLYKFLKELRKCSKGFSLIARLPPFLATTDPKKFARKIGWYIFQVWRDFKQFDTGKKYNPRCEQMGNYGRYPEFIRMETEGL